jgi:Lon protease-like protein
MQSLFLFASLLAWTVSVTNGFVSDPPSVACARRPGRFKNVLPVLSLHSDKGLSEARYERKQDCPIPSMLPVFPLRKSVKLPTETLTLNLYEERYLRMADFILRDDNLPQVFGALYCSDKPQIVAGGVSPIVPLIEPGDVGAIFFVDHSEEGWRMDDTGRRRRVRICGSAIGRFRVERILHNGYGGGESTCSGENRQDPLPYILVEACQLQDKHVDAGGEDEERILHLSQKFKKQISESTGGTYKLTEETRDQESDAQEEENESRGFLGMDAESDELFSFAAVIALIPEGSTRDMQLILKMESTLERLEFLEWFLKGGSDP